MFWIQHFWSWRIRIWVQVQIQIQIQIQALGDQKLEKAEKMCIFYENYSLIISSFP